MKKPRIFYGYWIVAVAFLCLFFYGGLGYYAFAVFYSPLETEFGWGRGQISVSFTIIYLIQAVISPIAGRLVDRYGARKLMIPSAFFTGIGFMALFFVQNIWTFYILYAFISLSLTGLSPIPVTKLVTAWFKKRLGFAVGITSAGLGVAALLISPLVGALLLPNFGWRMTYVILGFMTWALIVPVVLILKKGRPEDMGLHPDGAVRLESVRDNSTASKPVQNWTLSAALKTLPFWLIAIGFTLDNACHTSLIIHQVNFLTDLGYPLAIASVALGATGVTNTMAKFVYGWCCDIVPPKYTSVLAFAQCAAGVVIFLNLKADSPSMLIWLYAVIFGLGMGGWLPNLSMITSDKYGVASYGAIFGAISFALNIGTAMGPLIAGVMYDAMGSYSNVFKLILALYIVAIVAILLTKRGPQSPPKPT